MTQLDRQVADLKEMSATLASIGTTIDNLRDERDRLNYKLHSKNKIITHLRIEFNRIHAENARMQIEIQRLTLQLESALHPK